jgi:hypothetical protein
MRETEILRKAILKAFKNGFRKKSNGRKLTAKDVKFFDPEYEAYPIHIDGVCYCCKEQLLFDHEFAKCFWSRKAIKSLMVEPWEYHLQEMVLGSHPVKYIEQFL